MACKATGVRSLPRCLLQKQNIMCRKLYKTVLGCMAMLMLAANTYAQTIIETRLTDVFEKTPRPPAHLQQALDDYGSLTMGETPSDFRTALDDIDHLHESILTPLFEKFESNLDKAKSDKTFLSRPSLEEQKMVRDFATLRSSWGGQAMYGFKVWIEYRQGIAKQSWAKISQPLSSTAQNYYQQLIQMERSLKWPQFLEEAHENEGLIPRDEAIDELNKSLSADLDAVPTKKVKFAEGSDVMVDMKNADKSIEVLKKWEAKAQQIYKQGYERQYLWWTENYNRIKSAAIKLDDLLAATNYGNSLSGSDRQLIPVMADVQARIVGLLHHLTNISTRLIGYAQQANLHKIMTEESIESLKKIGA